MRSSGCSRGTEIHRRTKDEGGSYGYVGTFLFDTQNESDGAALPREDWWFAGNRPCLYFYTEHSSRCMAWHDLDSLLFFFFGWCFGFTGDGRLWEGAVVAAEAGTWIPIPTFFSFLLTELQKGDGRELNLFGQKGRLGLALHLGRGWVVASTTTHRGEGGLRVPMLRHRNHEPNRIEVSYLPILHPSSQRGNFIQSDIRARTGSEDGEEILYPIFFPIWAFACAWILGCFVSGFGGGISETYIRWGGYILQTHITVERCHMKRIARN